MSKIEKKTLKDELKYRGSVVLTYRIEYPEIVESECEYGSIKFNRLNRYKARRLENYILTELYREAVELYKYNLENGYPIIQYEIIQEYEITYDKNCILSLYYDQYEYRGGAHGNTLRTSQNWNLRRERIIMLWELYPNNPYFILDILKEINRQIAKQIEDGTNYYFENYGELVVETFNVENFYLTDDEITIFFQSYDIAPYSSGIPIFNIAI